MWIRITTCTGDEYFYETILIQCSQVSAVAIQSSQEMKVSSILITTPSETYVCVTETDFAHEMMERILAQKDGVLDLSHACEYEAIFGRVSDTRLNIWIRMENVYLENRLNSGAGDETCCIALRLDHVLDIIDSVGHEYADGAIGPRFIIRLVDGSEYLSGVDEYNDRQSAQYWFEKKYLELALAEWSEEFLLPMLSTRFTRIR